MTQKARLEPSPFFLEGGTTGILLIHGFTGAPPEMRLIGDYLNQRGLTVSGPLLPGHGTTEEDMNRCRWTDWTKAVEDALGDLRAKCDVVFVGGLSMGGLLTLHLAETYPDLPGAVLYAPALLISETLIHVAPVLKYFVKTMPPPGGDDTDLTDPNAPDRIWSYGKTPVAAAHELLKLVSHVKQGLASVKCPLLIVQSTLDRTVRPESAKIIYDHVSTDKSEKELMMIHNSGHCLTVDSEWEEVAERTYMFIQGHIQQSG